jgi:hypothetical protein
MCESPATAFEELLDRSSGDDDLDESSSSTEAELEGEPPVHPPDGP